MPIFKKSKTYMDSPKEGFSIAMGVKRRAPKRMASGGMVPMQEMDDSPVSISDAIMRRRKQAQSDTGMADIEDNAEETGFYEEYNEANEASDIYDEDQLSDQPDDSNDMGADMDDSDMDMVSAIRKRMKMKRSE